MSSLLSSGPLGKGIICHAEIWNRSMLHMLVLGHPLQHAGQSRDSPAVGRAVLLWAGDFLLLKY